MKYRQPFGNSNQNAPYANGNPSTGQLGSILDIIAVEEVQREILAVITHAGLTPNPSVLTQLRDAILSLVGQASVRPVVYVVDGGTADALSGTGSPALPSWQTGQLIVVRKAAAENATTVPTINIDGRGAKVITRQDGSPLAAGELPGNGVFAGVYDGTGVRLLTGASTTQITQIINENYARGSRIGQRVYTTPGTVTYTKTPGTRRVRVIVQGGGGGAGSAGAGGSYSISGGGGGGGVAISELTSGFDGATVTVGAGGAGGTGGANGVAGGTSSFGALLSATGGAPGTYGLGISVAAVQAGGAGGNGISGNVWNGVGGAGMNAVGTTNVNMASGSGGSSYFGAGASGVFTTTAPGIDATTFGTGGGGAANQGGAAQPGGAGKGGIVTIEEFA